MSGAGDHKGCPYESVVEFNGLRVCSMQAAPPFATSRGRTLDPHCLFGPAHKH